MEFEVSSHGIEDLLVCGSCQRNFPLGNIVNFVHHKKFDCADVSISGLTCQSCPQQFGTAWSLMKHAQSVHALNIYLETGTLPSEITEVSCYSDKQSLLSKTSNNGVERSKSNTKRLLSESNQSVDLSGAVTFMLKNSLSDGLQVLPARNVDIATQDQFNNSELMQSSLCSNLSENFENMPKKAYNGQKKSSSIDSHNSQHISGDLTVQTTPTESGIEDTENVSDHSTVLEKCCTSVLPKKRKRHMEIKHASSRKRAPVVSSGPTSIYIDLEPGSEGHSFQASVSHNTLPDAMTVPESDTSETLQPSLRRRSVIIQPGMTFSIPVSHASDLLASSLNYPIVANPVTSSFEQKSMAEQFVQACNMVDNKPTAAETVTYHPVQEPTGKNEEQKNSADESLHDDLLGEEQGQGKTLEHKRRRYPTSRPFKCDQCDNAFNQRIHLKKHQSKHTGVKPFKCDQCDYSTVERSHLKVHIRVHTGEKPYKCTYCEYATAQNSTLKIHLRRHHHGPVGTESSQAAAAYVCSKCGLQFEQRDLYQCHDAEQHTSAGPMQSQISVSSAHEAAASDSHVDSHS